MESQKMMQADAFEALVELFQEELRMTKQMCLGHTHQAQSAAARCREDRLVSRLGLSKGQQERLLEALRA